METEGEGIPREVGVDRSTTHSSSSMATRILSCRAPMFESLTHDRQKWVGSQNKLAFRIAKCLRVSVLIEVLSSDWMFPVVEKKLCHGCEGGDSKENKE